MKRSVNAASAVVRALFTVSAAAAILCGQASAQNDVITKWTFQNNTPTAVNNVATGPQAFSDEGPQAGTSILQGFHTRTQSDWSVPAGNGSSFSYSVNEWTADDYYQFSVNTLGLSNLGVQFDQVSSNTGPRDFQFSYSTNGSIFTPVGSYIVQPNATPSWASAGAVAPAGLDTYNFDLRSITALNNISSAFFRITALSPLVAANPGSTIATGGTNRLDNVTVFNNYDPTLAPVPQPPATPVLPVAGNLVLGISSPRAKTTIELLQGAAVASGGSKVTPYSPWTQTANIQGVRFDNLNNTLHNANGNLLGVDFGASATIGGAIYSFATQGSPNAPAGQLIGNTTGLGESAVDVSRLAGLSVSPSNNKIALVGTDKGTVIVYDYAAGNSMGTGASLSGGRQTALTAIPNNTQGTAWKDNNIVMAFTTAGNLIEVDSSTMAVTPKISVTPGTYTSMNTALAYNPNVSPLVYAAFGGFSAAVGGDNPVPASAQNWLYIIDPATNAVVNTVDLGNSPTTSNTVRDLAMDAAGNLFISRNATEISVIANAAANAATITGASAVKFYQSDVFGSSFNGLDIAFAPPVVVGVPGDYNNNGTVDAADYVLWKNGGPLQNEVNAPGTVNQQDYVEWRSRFGNSGAGTGLGGTSVPEPTAFVMLLLGLVPMYLLRRSA